VTGFPAHWETDAVLADGGTVHIRPISPDDGDLLVDLHGRLSERTIYYRFFSPRPRLSPRDVQRFTTVDHVDRVALVALLDDRFIAVARYDRVPGTTEAEVAFVVADEHQGRGVGTLLLEHLAAAARERGITRFYAETLPDNRPMQSVFKQAGWEAKSRWDDGVVRVEFAIEPTPDALAAQLAREHRADARSVGRLLRPATIAVVGASREPGALGHEVFRNLLDGGFTGPVYPVNRDAVSVGSVAAWPTLADVPDHIDLVVIATPAPEVPDVVEQCVAKRVLGIVIVSTGFGELDEAGLAAERAIVRRARGAGMRVVGPGSMGVVNTDPDISMSAVIGGTPVLRGRVGILSQSGALGVGLLRWATQIGLGVSSFVAVGNKADVSGNDVLQHWEDDDDTDVVLLYLESFGNPRKFARVARRVASRKPVLAVRAGSDPTVDALFRQTGVIRVDSPERLFEAATVLATQPLPRGDRVGVVADAGGPSLLSAQAIESAGLHVASTIDVALDAVEMSFGDAVQQLLDDDGVDAVVVTLTDLSRVTSLPAGAKPVLVTLLSPEHLESDLPAFRSPEAAAMALAAAVTYSQWRARPDDDREPDGIDTLAARLLVEAALTELPGGVELSADDSQQLLDAFGIRPLRMEMSVTVAQDATFGPVLTLVVGGAASALIDDRVESITPLTARDAGDLVRSLRTAPLLFRDLDVAPLEDALLRVSRLVEDVPEVETLALDLDTGRASIRLAPWAPRPDLALRRLR
jgi:acyl-CoA synthetase (NDP forming)/GNAT superfamily N-acetyltransferase